jgi:hypothetical protein
MVVVGVAVIGTVVVLVGVAAVDALVVVILLVGVVIAVVVLVVAVVILVAELVFDYLVADMQNFHVPDPVVVLTIVLVPEHADLLLIPTVARRGGIARGGRACGICSDHGAGAGSTRRTRCARTCRGARRSWGARAGGTRSACGCSRGICRSRRTCGGARRIRGGICRTRGVCGSRSGRACGVRRSRSAGSIRRTRCARTCSGIGRSRGGACRVRGACAGGTRRSARCRTCSGIGRSRGDRGGGILAWPEVVVHIHMML